MSKQKKQKKKGNSKSGFSFLPLFLCVMALAGICTFGYFTSKNNPDNHTHEKGEQITVELPEITDNTEEEPLTEERETPELPEPIIDIPTIPVSEDVICSLQMGKDILYTLYRDGTLKVTGTGSTFAFATVEDYYAYLSHRLQITEAEEMQGFLFGKVIKIEIEPTVDVFQDFSFALYSNTEEVIYKGSLLFAGENAFLNCGKEAEKEIIWNMEFSNAEIEDGAFNGCKNSPAVY